MLDYEKLIDKLTASREVDNIINIMTENNKNLTELLFNNKDNINSDKIQKIINHNISLTNELTIIITTFYGEV